MKYDERNTKAELLEAVTELEAKVKDYEILTKAMDAKDAEIHRLKKDHANELAALEKAHQAALEKGVNDSTKTLLDQHKKERDILERQLKQQGEKLEEVVQQYEAFKEQAGKVIDNFRGTLGIIEGTLTTSSEALDYRSMVLRSIVNKK